jgi:PKD repeat protein
VTVTVASVGSGGYAQTVVSDGPFAYWRLNETNGATIADDFYGVYNGTIGAAVTAGVPGPQAPAFPGFETTNTAMRLTGAAGSVLTMPTLNLDTNTVTITGWMNPSGYQNGWAGVVFCRGGTTVSGVNFGPGSPANELRFTWNNNQFGVSTGLIVPTNQWSFFALVVTPTGGTVYLGTNGVLNSVTESATLTSSAFDAPLLLGEDPSSGGRYYAGALDEIAVFNQSLSPTQIQQLYSNALVAAAPPAPVASFTNNPASGPAPLTVNFYDISTNSPTNWSWTFGDGSGTSTVPNPSHTYDSPRSYVVTQIVANASGSSTNTGTISVFPFTFAQWQQVYGLTGTLSGGYACYTDDGMSNTNKFMAGFSPTNAAAYLHIISIATSSTNVVVTYLGASGDTNYVPGIQSRTNVLDFTTGDANGNYTNGAGRTPARPISSAWGYPPVEGKGQGSGRSPT